MLKGIKARLTILIAVVLCVQLAFSSPAQSAPDNSIRVKELNFVFLHGAGGNACSFQLLDDSIMEKLPAYILGYEQTNPDTEIRFSTLNRCYQGYLDIDTWANNIADSIDKHFHDKKNLILIGHSIGGKAALYTVAKNIGGLSDKVILVVTINSPIKGLNKYFVAGGGSVYDYCRAGWYRSDEGICDSVTYYDGSQDGSWVGSNKHWLAFISGETAPLSEQFDIGGVDIWPRNMDDGIIPLSAQYSDGADVIYYGEYGHSDFSVVDEVAEYMADQILRYIFGERIQCSVFARGGTLQHKADWLLGIDYWEDVVGEVFVGSGRLQHKNESYTKWQEWEDVVGERPFQTERSSYRINRVSSPFLTSIKESQWLSPNEPRDYRLYLRTRAAPRNTVEVEWSIYQHGLLPTGITRDHYEVELVTGTPLTGIRDVSWEADNPYDLRVRIYSEAQSPFRWFKAEWKVYYKEGRQRQVIDEIPGERLLVTSSGS